ncbi:MAG: SDR family NAD(P)-dependent oxidoreductase [Actinomycetota bacterium]|nr:SDR family NAD(P)-dependent oxidoreductase [Actinomycetota bacterium]
MKAVIVGASSGLGRCIGIGLARRGAQVALLARRKDRLVDAAAEAGPQALAVECDVTDEASVRRAVTEAAADLGGIDSLVYATGVGPLARLADIDAATWQSTFATNVTGAALVTAAALPHLSESSGAAVYLSSISATMTAPWPGLGAYIVSKAALEKLVEAWRVEHPQIGFTRLAVGDCAGGEGHGATEFNSGWDMQLASEIMPVWVARNYIAGNLLDVEELIGAVDTVLRLGSTASVPTLTVTPRSAQ